ncbi:sodium- and chloride-dependent glycine transporter 2-like [Saccostrea echinata]|uniref:sodium- and chloride-dependent glycine transporter 2-like n=1 Tax=Saccostrea echinata TaxID=191078 RepID=UPI002A7F2F3B|nr:sodium- and chloride-dependent glycine transporter 2-like [Saccostrea echinata]
MEMNQDSNLDDVDKLSNTERAQLENKRGRWGAKLDYMLSMVGYCVGLGNIWRFPYLCMRNGGGAFLIPFIFFLLAAGLPLFFLESSVGQFTGRSFFHVWKACPFFEGLGVGMFIVLFVSTLYYNVIITWTIFYLGSSFFSPLPWAVCENDWNTLECFHGISNMSSQHDSNGSTKDSYNTSNLSKTYSKMYHYNGAASLVENITKETILRSTSEEEFWFYRVLRMSEGLHDIGGLNWRLTICFLVAWIVVCICLIKGVKSVGKVVYITATLPYLLLIVILIKGLTLPGSTDGILFYIRPDFDKLASVQVWLEAGIQVFYSLGPAWGPLFTMASFNKFNNNCYRDSIILSMISEGTSIFGGFAIFTIVGYMAHVAGKPVDKVVQAGPGLAFLVYPEALSLLPLPNVWAVLFFLTLFTVGLDSQFTTLESCLTAFTDIFPRMRNHKALTAMSSCLFLFLVGLLLCTGCGIYIFQLLDWYIAAFSIPLFGVIECLVFGWIYGADNLSRDIEMMIGRGVPIYMRILWCVITPFLLVMLSVFSIYTYRPPMVGSYTYPAYGRAIGWIVAFLPMVPLPICAIRAIRRSKGDTVWKKLCSSFKPSEGWRPISNSVFIRYKIENRSGDFKSTILRNIFGR